MNDVAPEWANLRLSTANGDIRHGQRSEAVPIEGPGHQSRNSPIFSPLQNSTLTLSSSRIEVCLF